MANIIQTREIFLMILSDEIMLNTEQTFHMNWDEIYVTVFNQKINRLQIKEEKRATNGACSVHETCAVLFCVKHTNTLNSDNLKIMFLFIDAFTFFVFCYVSVILFFFFLVHHCRCSIFSMYLTWHIQFIT